MSLALRDRAPLTRGEFSAGRGRSGEAVRPYGNQERGTLARARQPPNKALKLRPGAGRRDARPQLNAGVGRTPE